MKCVYPLCENVSNLFKRFNRHISFHICPQKRDNIELRSKWMSAMGFDLQKDLDKNIYVCSAHFKESDYDVCGLTNRVRLKPNSVPKPFIKSVESLEPNNSILASDEHLPLSDSEMIEVDLEDNIDTFEIRQEDEDDELIEVIEEIEETKNDEDENYFYLQSEEALPSDIPPDPLQSLIKEEVVEKPQFKIINKHLVQISGPPVVPLKTAPPRVYIPKLNIINSMNGSGTVQSAAETPRIPIKNKRLVPVATLENDAVKKEHDCPRCGSDKCSGGCTLPSSPSNEIKREIVWTSESEVKLEFEEEIDSTNLIVNGDQHESDLPLKTEIDYDNTVYELNAGDDEANETVLQEENDEDENYIFLQSETPSNVPHDPLQEVKEEDMVKEVAKFKVINNRLVKIGTQMVEVKTSTTNISEINLKQHHVSVSSGSVPMNNFREVPKFQIIDKKLVRVGTERVPITKPIVILSSKVLAQKQPQIRSTIQPVKFTLVLAQKSAPQIQFVQPAEPLHVELPELVGPWEFESTKAALTKSQAKNAKYLKEIKLLHQKNRRNEKRIKKMKEQLLNLRQQIDPKNKKINKIDDAFN